MTRAFDSGAWDHPGAFIDEMQVDEADIDVLGHANNAAYLRWLERTAWAHTTALGLGWPDYQRLGVAMVVRRHELDYLAATYAGEGLAVATWITENDGRLSLWRGFQIRRLSDGGSVLRARSQFVCMRLDNGRPCRMPREFKTAYAVTQPSG